MRRAAGPPPVRPQCPLLMICGLYLMRAAKSDEKNVFFSRPKAFIATIPCHTRSQRRGRGRNPPPFLDTLTDTRKLETAARDRSNSSKLNAIIRCFVHDMPFLIGINLPIRLNTWPSTRSERKSHIWVLCNVRLPSSPARKQVQPSRQQSRNVATYVT